MKKFLSAVMVLVLLFGVMGNASEVYAASTSKPEIKSTTYDGSGRVNVTFRKAVAYKSAKVTVTDADGNEFTAKISSKGSRAVDFKVSKLKLNGKYKYKISGVKLKSANGYTSVSSSFKVDDYKDKSSYENEAVTIKKASYKASNKKLSLTFNIPVRYKNEKVTVKDSNGKKYSTEITSSDKNGMTVRVSGLKEGKKYTVSVSGVRNRDGGDYVTVKKSFTA